MDSTSLNTNAIVEPVLGVANPNILSASRLTFLMVGCQRCGTTWVDAALREHPQVYLPAKKQSYFFDGHYDRGFDWYLTNFDAVQPQHVAVGEVATGYCLPHAIPRVAKHLPHVKLIMTMRNPVERACSAYMSSQSERPWKDFDDYLANRPAVLERGHYAEQIEGMLAHYERSRILLLFYDDLVANDREYLRTIFQFLDIEENFESRQIGKVRNSTTMPRLRYAVKMFGLKPLMRFASQSRFADVIRRAKKVWNIQRRRPIAPAVSNMLIDYYRPWNARLSNLTGRDLSSWDR